MQKESSLSFANKIKQGIASAVIFSVGHLPLGIVRSIGASIGWFTWQLKLKPYKVTYENLGLSFPNMETDKKKALTKKSLIETGKLSTEIFSVNARNLDWLQSRIFNTQGEAIIQDAVKNRKGVILLAPHFGNWEVLSVILPTYAPLTALFRRPKQAYLENIIKKSREKTGATLVPTSPKGVAKLIRSLKSGGITAVLPDQSPAEGSGVYVPFFSEPAYTMTLVHGLIKRSNAVVVMAFALRVKDGFHVHFFPAPENIYSEDVTTSVRALNQGIEEVIEHAPEQYQWEYKRYKNRAPGAKMIYLF